MGAMLTVQAMPAEADIVRGLGKIISGVLIVPVAVLQGTVQGPPLFGTAIGAISGTIKGAGMLIGGVLDIASSALPLAKAAAPYLLPFVL
jgi:hypothetical protein